MRVKTESEKNEYENARDAAAKENATHIRHPLRCDGSSVVVEHFNTDKAVAFAQGADWGAFSSPVVLALVEAITEYKSESENKVPDALYKRSVRERMFKALTAFNDAKARLK